MGKDKEIDMAHEIMIFSDWFQKQKASILASQMKISEEAYLSKDDLLDDSDLSRTELEQSMRIRLKSREALYLKKIEQAQGRIQDGSFGICEECEEKIEFGRLRARPTATLCISCKEDEEHQESSFADGLRHKSLGRPAFA